ncbi:MAG: hypothetical protein CMH98_16850 [Oceanospirillaceae bacterium]|nr:hypothetical protein [Oceanospirillaceae bacterium]|tara:strand:- start:286 stop:549 length:264 start_codon:yes stop_codon:yes gene_type:complete
MGMNPGPVSYMTFMLHSFGAGKCLIALFWRVYGAGSGLNSVVICSLMVERIMPFAEHLQPTVMEMKTFGAAQCPGVPAWCGHRLIIL